MTSSSPNSSSESSADRGDGDPEGDGVMLELTLPPQRGDRLRAIAQQLGMTPSMAAQRAIDLVCDEVVTVQDDGRSTEMLLEEYQARLDLLHSVEKMNVTDGESGRSD